uniref:Uncharacterized protein n=1 Tax=Aegilops tauschii subsp. strangulata TaxID=200361 RepID=A0A453TEG5_AEGTS
HGSRRRRRPLTFTRHGPRRRRRRQRQAAHARGGRREGRHGTLAVAAGLHRLRRPRYPSCSSPPPLPSPNRRRHRFRSSSIHAFRFASRPLLSTGHARPGPRRRRRQRRPDARRVPAVARGGGAHPHRPRAVDPSSHGHQGTHPHSPLITPVLRVVRQTPFATPIALLLTMNTRAAGNHMMMISQG